MKPTLLILFFCCCFQHLKAQQIYLKKEPSNLKDFIQQIEEQTPYTFAYSDSVNLNWKISDAMNLDELNKENLIAQLNRNQHYDFQLIGNTITVKALKNVSQQRFQLSGTIVDPNAQPLAEVNIYVKEQATGTTTNEKGEFSLQLPQGTYTLIITYLGFADREEVIKLTKNTKLNLSMEESGESLDEVIITQNDKAVDIKKPQMSVNSLSMQEIKQIPVAMGEPDPLKSLLTLPGVTNAGEGSSGFNVRGGAADQNLVLLDGTPIYNDSHMFGFFSVFNVDAVNHLKLYKGGIPSKFGGRVSSVLDVHQHTGNDQDFDAEGSIGLISSKLKVEGPLQKDKGSFMLAGRTSYAHLFLKLADNDNSAQFYDINTKLNYRLNDKNALSFSAYYGNDIFDISDNFLSTYGNTMANLKWQHRFNDDINTHLSLFYSDYQFNLSFNSLDFKWESNIKSYGLTYDWKHYLSENIQLNYGAQAIYYTFNPGTLQPEGETSQFNYQQLDKKYALEPSFFLDVEQRITEKLNVRYGLRYSMFYRFGPQSINTYENNQPVIYNADFNIYEEAEPNGANNYEKGEQISSFDNFEPRIAISYALNDDTSFKASYNRMAQYLHMISNSQSPTPVNIWTPSGPFIEPQLLNQYAFGYFKNFSNKMYSLETEVFYKNIDNRIDYVDGADLIANNNIERVILNGKARAYGLEVLFRKNKGKFTGWASYTLSRAEQKTTGNTAEDPGIANGDWYLSPYDKLHNLNLTGNYDYSDKWSFSANFNLQSGQPVTFPNGYYEIGGIPVPNYSLRNENRLPTYHHLDLAATYTPTQKKEKNWQSYWVFSIYNVYNQKNAASIRFTTNDDTGINEARRLSIFGILPSVSYNFKF